MKTKKTAKKIKIHSERSKYLIFGGIFIVAIGIMFFVLPKQTATPPPSSTQNVPTWEIFSGTFPCADCSELDRTLSLQMISPTSTSGTYFDTLNYQGKSTTPITLHGAWKLIHGTPSDLNADVLELDSNNSQPEYLLWKDSKTLIELDAEKNLINSPFNETLTRK